MFPLESPCHAAFEAGGGEGRERAAQAQALVPCGLGEESRSRRCSVGLWCGLGKSVLMGRCLWGRETMRGDSICGLRDRGVPLIRVGGPQAAAGTVLVEMAGERPEGCGQSRTCCCDGTLGSAFCQPRVCWVTLAIA